MLLDPALHIAPVAELLLFSAARAQLVTERIRPALESGHVVLCDRFYDSTTAYQGAGRHVADTEWIASLHKVATGGLVPDRTYWIDISRETADRRMGANPRDRMEIEESAFYDRVAACYERLASDEPARFFRIDGEQRMEDVHAAIWKDMAGILGISAAEGGLEPPFRPNG